VGGPLARRLAEHDARPILTDVDDARVKELADELDAEVVPPDDAVGVECDVFSPCATGGVLTAESIPRLRCRVVAGAANNQLGEPEDADRLAARGILYAPDYVVNAGGIIHLASLEMLGEDLAQRDERVRAIGDTLTELFGLAEAEGISTGAAAERMARARLDEGRH
jgi:leucine dehydrogenase